MWVIETTSTPTLTIQGGGIISISHGVIEEVLKKKNLLIPLVFHQCQVKYQKNHYLE